MSMNMLPPDPERIFGLLTQEGVDVVLIGGLAAVVQGALTTTNDVDLCYNADSANLSRLVRALTPLRPRLRVANLTDDEARALPFHWDERTLRDTPIITLQTDAGSLDLMDKVPGVGSFEVVRSASVGLDLFGTHVVTLDLPAVIASKRAAGRTKDLLVLPQMEMALRLRGAQNHTVDSSDHEGADSNI